MGATMAASTDGTIKKSPKSPARGGLGGTALSSGIVLLLIVAAVFGFGILPRILEGSHALVGKPVPALSLPIFRDPSAPGTKGPVDLASLKGKVVVLDFWAPWCGPCRHEMPVLDGLAKKFASSNVMVIGVLVDEDRDSAKSVLENLHISYPQLDDDEGKASRAFSIKSLPSLVVVDRNGKIVSFHTGYTPEEELERVIKSAM
jgi:thiol-disulfide isomerase/thioredoxin